MNADDAAVCIECRQPLRPTLTYARRAERRAPREEKQGEERDMCFGPSRSGYYWGIFIGAMIVLWGGFELLKAAGYIPSNLEVWPLIIIAFGVMVIISILSRPKR